MRDGLGIVLDVGKTLSKLTIWTAGGTMLDRRTRPNARCEHDGAAVLDVAGIEEWLKTTLASFTMLGRVRAIIPVGHGAGAAMIRDGRLLLAPSDYEAPVPTGSRAAYDRERDPFADTGSPSLPDGLNLGVQLHLAQERHPDLFRSDTTIVTWAQYWAWLLSGIAATEVSSLGCHTDLWLPASAGPSGMARRRGWASLLAPVRRADEVLGPITPEWAAATGLPHDVKIHCGLHDSNAALLAARGFREIAEGDATVLSTGTWFVAMRSPAPGTTPNLRAFPSARDCLVNIDVQGRPVPSARFMGGREIELLTGVDARRIDIKPDQPDLLAALPSVVVSGAMVLPTMAPGFGPYLHGRGRWLDMPVDMAERRAAVSLYAALVADTSLDLIGATDRILVEGRFAEAEVFVRGLATLRPDTAVYVSNAHNDVSYGALRLLDPSLAPASELLRVAPLDVDLTAYARAWRAQAEQMEAAA